MKILITGSSGTIGTRLFEKLLVQGFDVIGFDKKRNKWNKELNSLTIVGNLLKKSDLEKIPKDVDAIIHLAANPRVYDLVVDPDLARDNMLTVYNILEFARRNNVKKVMFSSSRETYGNRKIIKSSEKDVDIRLCESPYAASKITGEVLMYSYQKCYGIDYIVFRFSNVYGMYDESARFIPLMYQKMKNNEDVVIFGKDKLLDFTYIDDCVNGIIKCVKNFKKAKNNTINIAAGRGETLLGVAKIIKKIMGSKSKITIGKNRTGEVVKYVADITLARKLLGYKPEFSIDDGLNMSIDWYKKCLKL